MVGVVVVVVRMSGVGQSFVFVRFLPKKKLCEGQTDLRTHKPSCRDLVESGADV